MGAPKTSQNRTHMNVLPFTAELRREEAALNARRLGEPRPEISNELKKFWHARTLNRAPDAKERKQIREMFAGHNQPGAIGSLLELHDYRVLEVLADSGRVRRDPRN
jgi:hypothetical protein